VRGEFQCRVIRVADLYRVSGLDLLGLLGTNADSRAGSPSLSDPALTC
jgi:hypothetical protein